MSKTTDNIIRVLEYHRWKNPNPSVNELAKKLKLNWKTANEYQRLLYNLGCLK